MKRPAGAKNPAAAKLKDIKDGIGAADIPERLQQLLSGSVGCTLGHLKAQRHPFNERIVAMIGEVFDAHKVVLDKDVADKEAAVTALTPAKSDRDAALEVAKSKLKECGETLDKAKQAVKDAGAAVKEATTALNTKVSEQATGDAALNATEASLANLKKTKEESLGPILAGDPALEDKKKMLQDVMDASKTFGFDASLMEASFKVLEKKKDDRGDGFDETCLNQLTASFESSAKKLEDTLAEGAPGKAERAAAVAAATSAKEAAEKQQEEANAALAKAKEEKEAASEGVKAAKQSIDDFLPDLKAAGDALDEARDTLQNFTEGALEAYATMKDLTEETFVEPEPEEPPAEEPAAEAAVEVEEPAAKKARVEEPAAEVAGSAEA